MLFPEERRSRLLNAKQADEPAVRVLQAVLQRSDRKRATDLASGLRAVRAARGSAQPKEPLLSALILKPVGDRCNLRCRYCFNRQEETKPFTRMSKAVLERAVSAGLTAGSDPVHFIWHGGEPLLAGLDFFRQAVEMQRDLNRTGKRVKNSVQTNGTLLNEEWIEFFRRNTFSISISLDGPSVCHDRHRRYSSGKGSFYKRYCAISTVCKSNTYHSVSLR